jgi:hypothetical protein
MASGSLEIDTYSWYRSFPLSNDSVPYSTATMFATGECGFMRPYSFYQYQSTSGFPDTSTMSVNFTGFVNTSLISSVNSLSNSIYENRRQFVSTVPLTRWISTNAVGTNVYEQTYPYTYTSTFQPYTSTILSTAVSTIGFISTYNTYFGNVTSNFFQTCGTSYNCYSYSFPSSIPILNSTIQSTLISTINSNFQSTIMDSRQSSIFARAEPFDFTSSFSNIDYTSSFIQFSNVWLGEELQRLIDGNGYNVFVDCQYSLYISTNYEPYTWVSSVGAFGLGTSKVLFQAGYLGRTTTTRAGYNQYSEIHTKQMFKPERFTYETQLATFNSNYYMNAYFKSTSVISETGRISGSIFAPGENNFTFTLVPVLSTISDV